MTRIELAIDASRNRSGGARSHLLGLLTAVDPTSYGISKVHLWSYKSLLDSIPNRQWLHKHNPPLLEKSLLHQVFWQLFVFPKEYKNSGCNIVFNTDAGTLSSIWPAITMSRDMLSYEPGEIERYRFGWTRIRLWLLRYIQNRSLRRADGVVFLTNYASQVIQNSCGNLSNFSIISHGVSDDFRGSGAHKPFPKNQSDPINLIYISNADLYKHQWNLIKAVKLLRDNGLNLYLTLVGGGSGRAYTKLLAQKRISDPDGNFIFLKEFVPQSDLPNYLKSADIFVFASSCENMPNTLIEGMASGLPIACSRRGPMPEVLQDAGLYFDPENTTSIAKAIHLLVSDSSLRNNLAKASKGLSNSYSWDKCAQETWSFVAKTYTHLDK